jgi:hypothetical protein
MISSTARWDAFDCRERSKECLSVSCPCQSTQEYKRMYEDEIIGTSPEEKGSREVTSISCLVSLRAGIYD